MNALTGHSVVKLPAEKNNKLHTKLIWRFLGWTNENYHQDFLRRNATNFSHLQHAHEVHDGAPENKLIKATRKLRVESKMAALGGGG